MDKISRQPEQIKKDQSSRNLSFSERDHRRKLQAAEHSRSQNRSHADLGKTSGTPHKKSEKVDSKSKDRSSSRPQGRSSQPMSSSRSGTLHVRRSWQLTKEISVTPNSAEGSSKLGKDNRKLKGGSGSGFFVGVSRNIDNGGGMVIFGNGNTLNYNEDTSEHQPAADAGTSGS
jgi:hypothetical protein